jgi:hypothetical protein
MAQQYSTMVLEPLVTELEGFDLIIGHTTIRIFDLTCRCFSEFTGYIMPTGMQTHVAEWLCEQRKAGVDSGNPREIDWYVQAIIAHAVIKALKSKSPDIVKQHLICFKLEHH